MTIDGVLTTSETVKPCAKANEAQYSEQRFQKRARSKYGGGLYIVKERQLVAESGERTNQVDYDNGVENLSYINIKHSRYLLHISKLRLSRLRGEKTRCVYEYIEKPYREKNLDCISKNEAAYGSLR